MEKPSILLIYTGGTIGMREDPLDHTLKPYDFTQIMAQVPELKKFACQIDAYTFSPLIDSSDVEPGFWKQIASLILKKYDDYDGFVVLHGTDTMAYSASALSFMLEGLDKPVIFTGSQLPIGWPRTDGKENLISSVEIATRKNALGKSLVPEVCVYFGSCLMRGNRTTKVNADRFDAFRSPNYPLLATAGIHINFQESCIRHSIEDTFSIHTNLDTRVSILKVHPGLTEHIVRHHLLDPDTRAVIMDTYGSGNSLSRPWFVDIVREACLRGKIVLNVTQCQSGTVEMTRYATGHHLEESGVVSGGDMTTEAALGKLFVLMGQTGDNEQVKRLLTKDLRGELTASQ